MQKDNEEIKRQLERTPGWDSMTAFERTTLYCRAMQQEGLKIPAWMAIREIIGKGSPADIMKGVEAARAEHSSLMKKLGGALEGLPKEVSNLFIQVWSLSVDEAEKTYLTSVREWETKLKQAEDDVSYLRERLSEANEQNQLLKAENASQGEMIVQLNARIQSLEEARKNLEALLNKAAAETDRQRQELTDAIEKANKEVQSAVSRLEGVEQHSLREIERIRAEVGKKYDSEATAHKITVSRNEKYTAELREEIASQRDVISNRDSQINALTERCKLIESQSNEIKKQNTSLINELISLKNKKEPQAKKGDSE